MHNKNVISAGEEVTGASKALIMIHGRGGSATDILSIAGHLNVRGFAILAPQATGNTWYPYSFLAPPSQNEPALSSALSLLTGVVSDLKANGISESNLYFLGFSQGACLALEFVTRNAKVYGGVIAFTGGLIGDRLYKENYQGDFAGTPVFIGSGDPDPHVPVQRVNETETILQAMNAAVTKKIYKGMGHTINQDEIDTVNKLLFPATNG